MLVHTVTRWLTDPFQSSTLRRWFFTERAATFPVSPNSIASMADALQPGEQV
ncbi:hypothetical protein [Escherichia coli]|uniref:hypothetical protein n=1 Tax=Escherichia coli TaxID=562 RepID=UPI00208DC914|nr:hypothetical protein [Escherichia coli]